MQTFYLSQEWLIGAFLIWIRTGAIFLAAPFFGHTLVPTPMRLLLSLGIAFCLAGLLPVVPAATLDNTGLLLGAIFRQAGIGLALGFVAQILFAGIQLAGHVVGTQSGFSLINIIDPQTSVENPLITVFLN